MLLYLVVFFIFLILAIINYSNYKTKLVKKEDAELIPFKTEFRFDDTPKKWEVDLTKNKCLGETFCNTESVLSCINCQSSLAKCVHIEEDLKTIQDGEEIILSANKSKTEGYCLHIIKLTEKCSIHGDLVLVKTSPDSTVFFFLCLCKNPGLIGNSRLNENCTTPFICNGKVDNVNVPIEKMNCICDSTQIPSKSDGVPICVEKTFNNASSKDIKWNIKTEHISKFSKDIFNKMITYAGPEFLPTPCGTCPITGVHLPYREKYCNTLDETLCVDTYSENICSVGIGVPMLLEQGNITKSRIVSVALVWREILLLPGFLDCAMVVIFVCHIEDNENFKHLFNYESKIYIRSPNVVLGINLLPDVEMRLVTSTKFNHSGTVYSCSSIEIDEIQPWNWMNKSGMLRYQENGYNCPWPLAFCSDWIYLQENTYLMHERGGVITFLKSGIINPNAHKLFKHLRFSGAVLNRDLKINALALYDLEALNKRVWFGEYRNFDPGDSARHQHWNSSF